MNRLAYALMPLLFALVFFAARGALAGAVTIAGDPCSVPLIVKLAERFAGKEPGFEAEVSTFSCTLGVYKAADGEVEMGVSTQNGLDENLPKGGVNTVIARSPIVLVVNRDNPVDNLAYDELRGIYSGKIANWAEVGGPDLEIRNVMLEPCVRHTMSKKVLIYGPGIEKITPGEKVNPVTRTNTLVEENRGAIGQQIYGYQSDRVKVLRIDGVLPDGEALPDEYPFYQDFNVVTRGEPAGVVREFIDFAFSEEGREVMREMKHVPVERAVSSASVRP